MRDVESAGEAKSFLKEKAQFYAKKRDILLTGPESFPKSWSAHKNIFYPDAIRCSYARAVGTAVHAARTRLSREN